MPDFMNVRAVPEVYQYGDAELGARRAAAEAIAAVGAIGAETLEDMQVERQAGQVAAAQAQGAANAANAAAGLLTDIGQPPLAVNLFDNARATVGSYIQADGSIAAGAGITLSAPIRVNVGTSLVFARPILHRRFLNGAGAYLSGSYGGGLTAGTPIVVPEGATFVQFDQASVHNTRQMLLVGSSLPARYRGAGWLDPQSDKRAAILESRRTVRSIVPGTINRFDKSRATLGTAMGGTGAPYPIAGWFTTPKIEVDPGAAYIANKSSGANGAAQYDEDGVFLRTFPITSGTSFVCPDDCYFVAFQVNGLANADTLMFVEGGTLPSGHVPFQSPATLADGIAAVQASTAAAEQRQPTRKNLFDLRTATDNMALSEVNGAAYGAANRFYSAVIAVTPGIDVWVSTFGSTDGSMRLIWRSATGGFVSAQNNASADAAYTPPAGAYGLQVDCPHYRWKDALMVSVGSTKPSGYRPFVIDGQRPKQDAQVILLGDSFTDRVATAGGWVPYFVGLTGASIIANHAKAGRATRDAVKTSAGAALTAADFAAATDVLIPLGTNDYGGNRALGTLADAASGYSGAPTFYNDVFAVLATLYGFKPELRIAWATPTIRGDTSSLGQPTYPAANNAGATLPQYRDAILQVCELFGTPVIDMFRISGFNPANLATLTTDNLHPNIAIGNPRYGRTMARAWNAV